MLAGDEVQAGARGAGLAVGVGEALDTAGGLGDADGVLFIEAAGVAQERIELVAAVGIAEGDVDEGARLVEDPRDVGATVGQRLGDAVLQAVPVAAVDAGDGDDVGGVGAAEHIDTVLEDELEAAAAVTLAGGAGDAEAEPHRFRATVRVGGEGDERRVGRLDDGYVTGVAVGNG